MHLNLDPRCQSPMPNLINAGNVSMITNTPGKVKNHYWTLHSLMRQSERLTIVSKPFAVGSHHRHKVLSEKDFFMHIFISVERN